MAYFDCFIGDTGGGVALVITCASQFAGTNITITDGVTTYVEQCPSTSPYEITIPAITPGTWTISGTYSGTTFTTTKTIMDFEAELLTIPDGSTATPTDDVQTLLNCANIWDKAYTTIAEVIVDTTSLLAIISDNNAVDYLVRSTTWASAICADQTAMTYIGAEDYCAESLLDDNTWMNEICNSADFELVLNVKVPTMTSATTPSGIVTASSQNPTYQAYYAFYPNGMLWNSAGSAPQSITYQFPQPVRINRVDIQAYYESINGKRVKDYIIQASSDGNTFVDLDSGTIPNDGTMSTTQKNVVNSTKYEYLRLLVNNTWTGATPAVATLQYYGRV